MGEKNGHICISDPLCHTKKKKIKHCLGNQRAGLTQF